MKVTPAEIEAVLNVPALKGLCIADALEVAHAAHIDRSENFRYWASRGASGRGYRIACERIDAIEYAVRVLEAAAEIAAQKVADAKNAQFAAKPVGLDAASFGGKTYYFQDGKEISCGAWHGLVAREMEDEPKTAQ